MALDYVIGGVLAVLIGAYLLYALLRPERFWRISQCCS
jgi:K+-transporting ATPase KdpF subunit